MRQSSIWWAKYSVNGKPVTCSTETQDRDEAERFLYRKLAAADTAEHTLHADRVRMPQVFDLLEQDWEARACKSLGDLRSKLGMLRDYWGTRKASTVTSAAIADYVRHLKRKDLSNATINRLLAALRKALRLANKHTPCLLEHVPSITMLREAKPRSGIFSHDEYRRVRDLLPTYARVALVIAYHTGARRSEIVSIRREHIRFDEGRILIPDSKSDEPRYIPIYGDMEAEIRQALDPATPWLLHRRNKRGKLQHVESFYKAWATACEAAGVAGKLFHDLRRTAVTNMVNAGFSENEAMAVSGHKTRSVFDRYHIVKPERLKAMAERLQAHLTSEAGRQETVH